MPAGIMLLSSGISSSFSEYTLFFFLFRLFFVVKDFDFCAPPGLASDMDFCLRFDMPSGSLPAVFGFAEDFPEDLPPPDLPFGLFPFVDERIGAIVVFDFRLSWVELLLQCSRGSWKLFLGSVSKGSAVG